MPVPPPIRILAPAQESGDLFGRLVSDLFLALGYDQPRLNIHKAGREIDVLAKHRTEPRWVIAECKATAKPVGGADLNKFAGALQAERWKLRLNMMVAGYFLSLSGFTETALEQERDLGELPRMTLLDGRQIVQELIRGRIIVSPERALERAGRSAMQAGADLVPENVQQLLAHELGWVWAVCFRRNLEPTHVALVHADGELLSPTLTRELLEADRSVGGDIHHLAILTPEIQDGRGSNLLSEARRAYFAYLGAECGEIELEGLPADQDAGSRRLRIESLFVPLHLEPIRQVTDERSRPDNIPIQGGGQEPARLPVGKALTLRTRLAVLAVPGGGKTTLLKRLAISYAFPERRTDLGDCLPEREWFPVLLRCRQIEERATEPIIALLTRLGERAEMGEFADSFRDLLLENLREGRVLLLVDGLDEIADSGNRVSFVTQLRTFLSTYPGVDVVVTSREAGFRIVAGALSAHCDHYRIADFGRADIERLTLAWHREVVGDRLDIESQARSLAAMIWETDRVRRLAVNPLLLTTLLLVRRWVGQLPNRRSVLYEKAIEVLLWTWNVQGFEPLDIQEVIPQLTFLAWRMMEDEIQRISQRRLMEVLEAARRQMPEVLAYARLSVPEFVERVERRSGLLVLSGHEVIHGSLVPLYEFRHLTFQEYLAAKAIVEGHYPDRKDDDTLLSKLKDHVHQETWREVIALAAVLAGRKAIPLVEHLTEIVSHIAEPNHRVKDDDRPSEILLGQCLLDEVQIYPELAEKALEAICRVSDGIEVYNLAGSRHGDILREVAWKAFSASNDDLDKLALCLRAAEWQRWGWPLKPELNSERLQQLEAVFARGGERDRAVGLLTVVHLAFRIVARRFQHKEDVWALDFSSGIVRLLPRAKSAIYSVETWEQYAGAWAIAWITEVEGIQDTADPTVIRRLLDLSLTANSDDVKRKAFWALSEMPLIPRADLPLHELREGEVDRILSLINGISEQAFDPVLLAALIIAYYGRFCPDERLLAKALMIVETPRYIGTGKLGRIFEELRGALARMIGLPYALVIEATGEPDYFGFFSTELEGFSGIGHSVEDCLYKARWGMQEHVDLLRERQLPVPSSNPSPTVTIRNEQRWSVA